MGSDFVEITASGRCYSVRKDELPSACIIPKRKDYGLPQVPMPASPIFSPAPSHIRTRGSLNSLSVCFSDINTNHLWYSLIGHAILCRTIWCVVNTPDKVLEPIELCAPRRNHSSLGIVFALNNKFYPREKNPKNMRCTSDFIGCEYLYHLLVFFIYLPIAPKNIRSECCRIVTNQPPGCRNRP